MSALSEAFETVLQFLELMQSDASEASQNSPWLLAAIRAYGRQVTCLSTLTYNGCFGCMMTKSYVISNVNFACSQGLPTPQICLHATDTEPVSFCLCCTWMVSALCLQRPF